MNRFTSSMMTTTEDAQTHSLVNAVVVSRSDIFNAGLRTMLRESLSMNAIFVFNELEQLVPASAGIQQHIDVVVVDEDSLPGRSLPYQWITTLKGFEDAAVVVTSSAYRPTDVADMLRRGARACLNRNMPLSLFVQAVKSALRSEWWVAEEYRERFSMKKGRNKNSPVLPEAGLYNTLTPAEQTVVKQLLNGMKPSEIAQLTGKSIKTVSGQKIAALKKLEVRNIAELHLLLNGLID